MKITDIENIISPMMTSFRSVYGNLTDSSISIIHDINLHIHRQEGKQLRPLLSFLSACCCGFDPNPTSPHPLYSIASAIELLHNSTLLHDDVVDESTVRRGNPTINSIWGNKTAVLVGDYYLAKVMQTVNAIGNNDITRIINDATIKMCEGELLQQQCCGKYDIPEETYIEIIAKKTAEFMSACCRIGAIIASASRSDVETLADYGMHIGKAFQMRDDLLDYYPSSVTGKPRGNDIREHKANLPLIAFFKSCPLDTKEKIAALLEKNTLSDEETALICDTVMSDTSWSSVVGQLEELLDSAKSIALRLPENKYRNAMIELSEILKISKK